MKENSHVVKSLKEFQYIDDDGRDQGANGFIIYTYLHKINLVRQKSKDITSLLADENRLREGRGSQSGGATFSSGPSSANLNKEDEELRKALEESKRSAASEEQKRLDALRDEKDLQLAIELSEEEARKARTRQKEP